MLGVGHRKCIRSLSGQWFSESVGNTDVQQLMAFFKNVTDCAVMRYDTLKQMWISAVHYNIDGVSLMYAQAVIMLQM